MSRRFLLFFTSLMLHSALAGAWGARAPEESGTKSVFNENTGTWDQINCSHGMTSRRSSSAAHRLTDQLRPVAAAMGERELASVSHGASDRMSRAIDHMMRNKYAASRGDCALFVRRGMAAAGLVPNIPLGHANVYVSSLSKYCFSNAIGQYPTPESAPTGAVLVYKGISLSGDKNAKYGHVEVKTSTGYVSDYYSTNPRTGRGPSGRNRQLIGVMIKPGNGDYRSCRK